MLHSAINVIENFFHLVRRELDCDALHQNIERETYAQFSQRVKDTIYRIPKQHIDKAIESLPRRMDEIIKAKGQRLRY